MTGEQNLKPCARGCTRRDRHWSNCPREECRGCLPRPAENGWLCYPCHKRLDEMLRHAPEQCHLLEQTAGMAAAPAARGDADLIHGSGELKTPIRLACIDTVTLIGDLLSEIVERLVEDYRMRGPKRLMAQADRDMPGRLRKSWVQMTETYTWTEPPARFKVDTAAPWLRAQVERMEHLDGIEGTWSALADAMAAAHALAPWRAEMARMNGIECPECHRCSLVHFGGDENVTCTECHASISPGRYNIWVRALEKREAESA